MNKLIVLTLFVSLSLTKTISQSDQNRIFMAVAYHKINPGQNLEMNRQNQEVWKIVHTARKNAGLISGWYFFTPFQSVKSPGVDFDYITINTGSAIDNLNAYPPTLIEELLKKYPQHGNLLEETGKLNTILRIEFYSVEAHAGKWGMQNQIYLFEHFKSNAPNSFEYASFEQKGKKAHEERIKNGFINYWSFSKKIVPTSIGGFEFFSTISAFPSMEKMISGGYTDEIAKIALGMGLADAYFKAHSLRIGEMNWLATLASKVE